MGVGKTTLGQQLARRMDFDFVDLDREVERQTGESIPYIFASHGETRFRDLEIATLSTVLDRKRIVVATGGGTAASTEAMQMMRRHGTVIWLRASVDTILSRTNSSHHRPLLAGTTRKDRRQRIETLLAQRTPFYAGADWILDTNTTDQEWLVDQAYDFLESTTESV